MTKLPDDFPTFRSEPAPDAAWAWRLEDAHGAEVSIEGDLSGERFTNQADAESWVGEWWADLAELGVDAVTLFEADRLVYGPMSLHA
ncbi:MAG: hypothetical protein L0H93_13625 [Nocardioides sp.]|nr:hypothetical protein [Nocardioides sp.]